MVDESGGQSMQMVGGDSIRTEDPTVNTARARTRRSATTADRTSEARSEGRRRGRAPEAGPAHPDLRTDLRDFAAGRPQGWSHDDWLAFLEWLQGRGHNVEDRDVVGRMLEAERLDLALAPVRGMGPQRRTALVERFGTIWNLRNADADEIASVARIPRELADRVKEAVS